MAAGEANARAWSGVEEINVPLPVPAGRDPVTMTFCRIPAGSFRMGARGGRDFQKGNEEPVHQVDVPYDFWMAKHVVTQSQYAAVFEKLDLAGLERPDRQSWEAHPSRFKNQPGHPVENVSWIDATLWCRALSAWLRENAPERLKLRLTGHQIVCSLPTEIEWEYACRAGTETEYWCGDDDEDLRRVAWFGEDWSKGSTHSVDARVSRDGDVSMANAFGLVGVHGNMFEWCRDRYEADAFAPRAAGRRAERQQDDADDISDNRYRVVRGGSWFNTAGHCRSAYRDWGRPVDRGGGLLGFRVCLVRGPGSVSSGGEAAAPGRGAQAEQAQQDKASGTRPQSSAAGEAGAAAPARCAVTAGIYDEALKGEGRQALEAAAGRSPAADADCAFFTADGPPALVVGKLDAEQPCGFRSLDFSRFTSLRHLILWGLTDVEAITGLPSGLERLDVRGCTGLKTLPTAALDHLETLDLGGCTGLGEFPAGILAPNLRWLYLDGCTGIADIGNHHLNALLEKAHSLEELSAVDCTWIRDLDCLASQDPASAIPSVGDPRFPAKRLKKLVLQGCASLGSLPDLSGYLWLHHLDLRRCEDLTELPAIPVGEEENLPTGIRTLYLTGCDNLKAFRGLDVRRVHRGEAIPSAGSKAPTATGVAVNVAGQFRTLSTLANEPAKMRMAKVLFLGSGRCGKTTIAKSLRWKLMTAQDRSAAENSPLDPCPDGGQASTPDIRLDALDMPATIGGDVVTTRVHVWDFGGQEIYHNTHRLFASEGAVFVIVTTTPDEHTRRVEKDIERLQYDESSAAAYRKENRYRELAYWLDYVWEARGLAGAVFRTGSQANPSVLVVFTGTPLTASNGMDGTLDLLRGQAGRYRDLIGNEIPFKVAPVQRSAFDLPSAPIDAVCQWVGQRAADISDELGVRVPRLYAKVEHKCTTILHGNQAIYDAIGRGETPATDQVERYTLRGWTDLVASFGPAIARSPRSRDEIAHAVAAYLHACGRVFFLPRADTVVVDQRWAVDLVYRMVVSSMAVDATRWAIHAKTGRPFDPAWFRSLFQRNSEILHHWDFLLGLLDACNIVIKLPSGEMLAVHPELLAHLDRDAENQLFRQWETTQPGSGQPALVNRSFAIHDTGNGLLLGRNAFQKVVATVARDMDGRLPRRLFLTDDEGENRDGIPRYRGSIPHFLKRPRFWRDGFQIEYFFIDAPDAGLLQPHEIPVDEAESLILRMEWKNVSSEGGFRGGIFVQMLCSDEDTKYERLFEYLLGRKPSEQRPTRSLEMGSRLAPPLAEYSVAGPNPDLEIHDQRAANLPPDVARSLRGLGSPGWMHPDGPTNNAKFDVAISYRRKSSASFVKALHAALTDADLLCYYDQERFLTKPGESPNPNTLSRIYDTLCHARVLIVVPSVEYFSLPMRADTDDDNLYCPVELAEAILAGNPQWTNGPFRPIQRHFWVRPSEPDDGSTYVTRETLATHITAVLNGHYDVVVKGRSDRSQVLNPVQVRENASVRRVTQEDPIGTRTWCQDPHAGDQYIDIPAREGGPAAGWDFTRVIAAVKQALAPANDPGS